MRAIIQSYTPQECERIINGQQTIKVCKTAPKDTPFRVYMYCTKDGYMYRCRFDENRLAIPELWNGKVVGEYVCERVIKTCGWRLRGNTGWCAKRTEAEEKFPTSACLTIDEIVEYAGGEGREVSGFNIPAVKFYDKPKKLVEFKTIKCTNKRGSCSDCKTKPDCIKQITRPPHGWQYVEDGK